MLILKLFVSTLLLTLNTAQIPIPIRTYGLIDNAVKWEILKQFQTSPAFKIVKDYVPVLGNILSAYYLIDDITKTPVKNNQEEIIKLDAISEHLNKITVSIENLDNYVVSEATWTNVNAAMENFNKIYSKITKSEHVYDNIMKSYVTNKTALLQNLETYLRDQKRANNEFSLVDYLDVNLLILRTPVDVIINFGRKAEECQLFSRSSTTKLVYDFHINLFTKVLRSFAYQELALEQKFELMAMRFDEDVLFLKNQKEVVKTKLMNSLKVSLNKLNDDDSKGYNDLNIGSIKYHVKFQNVLQTFIQKEINLNTKCLQKCDNIERVSYNGVKCKGEIRGCQHALSIQDQGIIKEIEAKSLGSYGLGHSPMNGKNFLLCIFRNLKLFLFTRFISIFIKFLALSNSPS